MAVETHPLRAIRWPHEDNKIPREIFTDPNLFRVEMDSIYNFAWPRHIVGPVWVELQESGEAVLGAHFMVWGTSQIGGTPLLLAVGEYRDIVSFADGVARFKMKTVVLDNPILQDDFVYPL